MPMALFAQRQQQQSIISYANDSSSSESEDSLYNHFCGTSSTSLCPLAPAFYPRALYTEIRNEGSLSRFCVPTEEVRSNSSFSDSSSGRTSSRSLSPHAPEFIPRAQKISTTNFSSSVSVNAPLDEGNAGRASTSWSTWSSMNAVYGGATSSRNQNNNLQIHAALDPRYQQEPTNSESLFWGSSCSDQKSNKSEPSNGWGVSGLRGAENGQDVSGSGGWGAQVEMSRHYIPSSTIVPQAKQYRCQKRCRCNFAAPQ